MKILFAGATGAIGQPALKILGEAGHQIYGITQSKERAALIQKANATPVVLDVLNKEQVLQQVKSIKPEAVIDMLTRLPKHYTPESMQETSAMDAKIRLEGGSYLQEAAELNGASRYIAQSSAFWYAPGNSIATENDSFALDASPGVAAGSAIYKEIENRVLNSKKLAGIALRFGFFYGPGTWFYSGADIAEQIQQKKYPLIGKGEGVWNFVHIDDAAKSLLAALECPKGVYNIVNNQPSSMNRWLPAFASYLKAPQPPHISEEEGLKLKGADAVYYATRLRAASNEKAKQLLNFKPRPFEWLERL